MTSFIWWHYYLYSLADSDWNAAKYDICQKNTLVKVQLLIKKKNTRYKYVKNELTAMMQVHIIISNSQTPTMPKP